MNLAESMRRRPAPWIALSVAITVMAASPAAADVPEGWSEPDPVSGLEVLTLMIGAPIAIFLVVVLLAYLPAIIRGEKLTPGPASPDEAWFGGPRSGAKELAGPDGDDTRAGGASARW